MHQLQKILFVSAFIFFTGCSQQPSNSQEIVFPTPNISDIVETKITEALAKIPTPAPTPNISDIVETKIAEALAKIPTPTPTPTPTPIPTPISGPANKIIAPTIPEIFNDLNKSIVRINTRTGSGTGFIISSNGFIVTNAHVVSDKSTASITLQDSTTYLAHVLAKDLTDDIALLKINKPNLKPVKFGSSKQLQIGEQVLAIGYALNLRGSPSITRGLVSGIRNNSIGSLDAIQTDAAINPGNSGGPLINLRGEVIGINTSRSKNAVGINYAISIDSALPKIEKFMSGSTLTSIKNPDSGKIQTKYINQSFPYSIFIPDNWTLHKISDKYTVIINNEHSGEISIKTEPVPANLTKYQYASINTELNPNNQNIFYEFLSSYNYTVANGLETWAITKRKNYQNSTESFILTDYFFIHNNYGYKIHTESENSEWNLISTEIDSILQNFRFNEDIEIISKETNNITNYSSFNNPEFWYNVNYPKGWKSDFSDNEFIWFHPDTIQSQNQESNIGMSISTFDVNVEKYPSIESYNQDWQPNCPENSSKCEIKSQDDFFINEAKRLNPYICFSMEYEQNGVKIYSQIVWYLSGKNLIQTAIFMPTEIYGKNSTHEKILKYMQSSFTFYKFQDKHNQYSISVPSNYMIGEIDNMDLFVYEPNGELTISVEVEDISSAQDLSLENYSTKINLINANILDKKPIFSYRTNPSYQINYESKQTLNSEQKRGNLTITFTDKKIFLVWIETLPNRWEKHSKTIEKILERMFIKNHN